MKPERSGEGGLSRRDFLRGLLLFLEALVLGGWLPRREGEERLPLEEIKLPRPRLRGRLSLEEALARRRSMRRFIKRGLTLDELSQLLWAAQGITVGWGGRTAPSAGALYPLEVYAVTPEGLYRYLPQDHKIVLRSRGDLRPKLWEVGFWQDAIKEAPVVFVIAAVYERTSVAYGARAERYVQLEAGHAAQNLLLQAVALSLGGVPIGAFYDEGVREVLSLPADHKPLYLIPVGHPKRSPWHIGGM